MQPRLKYFIFHVCLELSVVGIAYIFLQKEMTIVYNHLVSTGKQGFGNFYKLLFRWKGSIYRLVICDLIIYIILYYAINCTYRYTLRDKPEEYRWKIMVHQIMGYCDKSARKFPLEFVLGFYITQVVTRYWRQFLTIPWPDTLAIIVATGVQGHDERGRILRRTIMRYVNLCLIFTFTAVSTQCRKRFPTMEHLVEAGFLLPHEKDAIDDLDEKVHGPKYFVPLVWAGALGVKARKEGRITDDIALYHLVKELCKFRLNCGDLLSYDWICIPLVYTQVVTLAAYIYFAATLVGKQMINEEGKVEVYLAIFQFLEFFFLMGWVKVAEVLVNPFGDDDDDFEVNWLIDRNIMVSYMIVDEMNTEIPEMVKDYYWDQGIPDEFYYTEEALKFKTDGYVGSAVAAMEAEEYNVDSPFVDPEGNKGQSDTHMHGHGHHGHSHSHDHDHEHDKETPPPHPHAATVEDAAKPQ